ncbi:MAG: DUF5696 domain-containing protein [Halanaerobiales bacterium]
MIKNHFENIFVILIILIIVQVMTGAINAEEISGEEITELESFTIAAENDYLKLYIDNETTEIVVQDKSTGNLWFSNPPGREEVEKIARGSAREELNSQILLSYYLPGNKLRTMNNYSDSIVFQQYDINLIEDGVSIDYAIGKEWSDEDYVPMIIESKSFEEKVLSNLSESEQKFLLSQYHLLSLREKTAEDSRVDIHRFDSENVLGNYVFNTPEIEMNQNDMKAFIQHFLNVYVENREDFEGVDDFSAEDLSYLKDSSVYVQKRKILPWDTDKILDAFETSGYTPLELGVDYQSINLSPPEPNVRVFEVRLEYRIINDELLVKIPVEEIKYPIDVVDVSQPGQEITIPIYSLQVLPFFSAAGPTESGYIFVPDGSGAIIELNKNNSNLKPFNKRLYGVDYATEPREEKPIAGESLSFPVYGMVRDDRAFMAVIEEGDAYAAISADVAGRRNSYNSVSSRYVTLPKTTLELGDGEDFEIAKINLYQSRLPEGNIQIRYSFLAGDKANYVGMAHRYQDYMIDNAQLSKLPDKDEVPFMLELIGAIDEQKPVMGVPRRVVTPMTTYPEARSIIEELRNNQLDNISLRMTGWSAGGVRHYFPDGMEIEEKLGDMNDFEDLLDYLNRENVEFYPDLSFMNVYRNTLWDSYNTRSHNARFLNKDIAYIPSYDIATNQDEEMIRKERQIVSSRHLSRVLSDFLADYRKCEVNNLSLRYMGQQLNSDYRTNPTQTVDRQQSLEDIADLLRNLKWEEDYDLITEGSNSYVLPYVSNVVRMPLFSTGSNIVDRGVPFLPIALHGYVNFSGEPINMPQNKYTLLKYVETGAVPYYKGSYRETSVVKGTDFDYNYSLYYKDWFDSALSFYHRLDDSLSTTYSEEIADHQRLAENVYKTVYSNGYTVIVNYNNYDINIEGVEINAEDFEVIQGELK